MNENNGILGVISGDKPVRVSIEIDYLSSIVLGAAVLIVGLILIMISKKVKA